MKKAWVNFLIITAFFNMLAMNDEKAYQLKDSCAKKMDVEFTVGCDFLCDLDRGLDVFSYGSKDAQRISKEFKEKKIAQSRRRIVDQALELMNSKEPDAKKLTLCFWFLSTMDEYSEIFERLLKDYNMNPNFQDDLVGTILNRAIIEKSIKNVKLLLKYGADANLKETSSVFKRLPLECALGGISTDNYPKAYAIIRLLLEHNANPHNNNVKGRNMIQLAREKNLAEIADLMESYIYIF